MKIESREISSLNAAAPEGTPIARLINVSRRYRDVEVLSRIHLTVEQREMLAIVGPSGSGKTTLLNLIGLLDRPSFGEIELLGESTASLSPAQFAERRRHAIGFVFQSYNLIPVLDGLDNVLLPLRLNGRTIAAERERAQALLEEVGLAEQMRKRPDQMSGGQRQRVAIARALITQPKLVIADEPTASLDSQNTRTAMELFQRLNRNHGVTFVFSTHDERALNYMSRYLNLRDGQFLDRGEH